MSRFCRIIHHCGSPESDGKMECSFSWT